MKRIFSLLLAVILALSLGACKKTNTSSDSSEPTNSSGFVKPDGYAAVLNIKINPEFNLYIDINNKVLGMESVNQDATSFSHEIDANGKTAESVVQEIVIKSNQKGFLTNNGEISVSVTEMVDEAFDSQALLVSIEGAINTAASSLNITISINISNTDKNTETTQTESDNTSTKTNSNKPTSSTTVESGKNEQSSNTATEKHTHMFSAATCITPQKCSCGTTQGSALGHTWIPATCTTPKTCSVCKVTEGSKGSHIYTNEKCTVCGATNILNPKQHLKIGYEYEYVAKKYYVYSGQDIYAPGFQFCNDGGYGDGDYYCIKIDAMFTNVPDNDIKNRTPVNYNGKDYYRCGAGQSPAYLELTDSEIIVSQDSMKIKAVLLADGTIKITESTESDYPVGTLFSTEWSMLS